MKKCKGFTLLEMIVVVMIISILFLLTVPNVSKIMNSVESVGCDALLKVVDAAVIEFKIEYGEYPGSINDLVADFSAASEELLSSIESVLSAINDITVAMEEGAQGTYNIAERASEIVNQSSDVLNDVKQAEESATSLQTQVKKFTV